MTTATDPLTLYGTAEPPPQRHTVVAGPYRIDLVSGRLTRIRYRGQEILRGIQLVIRDDQWGTLLPDHGPASEDTRGDSWHYAYDGEAVAASGERLRFRFEARVAGAVLTVTARLTPEQDFTTSRTGLVLLHPLEGTVGHAASVRHSDGSHEDGGFPVDISPGQPFFDIAAIRHAPVPGLTVTCTLDGDVFEMEDQRNWTDASFKTYNRPLAWGSPYVLRAGETVEQTITVNVADERTAPAATTGERSPGVGVALRPGAGTAPALGSGIDVHELPADAGGAAERLAGLDPEHLQLLVDLRQPTVGEDLATAASTLSSAGLSVPLWFGLVAPDDATPADSLQRFAEHLRAAGLSASGLLALPAAYLKSYQPDGTWPDGPTPAAWARAAREAFPEAAIGGGMLSYFTEVNRCRPDADAIDYLGHSTAAIVHAADDAAVMETLEALPHVFRTGQHLAPGRPYRIGMSSIGMWTNPYGRHTFANAEARRLPMAWDDPRQRGLFGAAWHVGYYAAAAAAGVDALALSSPVAPFPVGDGDRLYPVFHVLRGLGRAGGAPTLVADTGGDERVAAVGWSGSGGAAEVWLANVTDKRLEVTLSGMAPEWAARLDADASAAAASAPDWLDSGTAHDGGVIELGPYAVVRATGGLA